MSAFDPAAARDAIKSGKRSNQSADESDEPLIDQFQNDGDKSINTENNDEILNTLSPRFSEYG